MPEKSASILEQIHTLAWAGKHQKAIELTTQELDKSNQPVSLRMDLLDLRAESYIAQGKLDIALNDAILMGKLANANTLKAQALNRQALVQTRLGKLKDALKVSMKALKLAKQTKKKPLSSITLSVKCKTDYLEFAVIDTGSGISKEMQAQIFEPFLQTEDGAKHVEGTGLGLPITKSLVESHGGRMWLESEVGEGSAFFLTLPIEGVA